MAASASGCNRNKIVAFAGLGVSFQFRFCLSPVAIPVVIATTDISAL